MYASRAQLSTDVENDARPIRFANDHLCTARGANEKAEDEIVLREVGKLTRTVRARFYSRGAVLLWTSAVRPRSANTIGVGVGAATQNCYKVS